MVERDVVGHDERAVGGDAQTGLHVGPHFLPCLPFGCVFLVNESGLLSQQPGTPGVSWAFFLRMSFAVVVGDYRFRVILHQSSTHLAP